MSMSHRLKMSKFLWQHPNRLFFPTPLPQHGAPLGSRLCTKEGVQDFEDHLLKGLLNSLPGYRFGYGFGYTMEIIEQNTCFVS
jgi:hypothetical protein